MKWVFRAILLIMFAFAAMILYGFFLPATQTIERSIQIDAYPEDVFPYLNDLQNYSGWSPLFAVIADAQIIYGGADQGVGQSMAWQGSEGPFPSGSQEITQSQPGEFVQTIVNLSGRDAATTHAVLPSENTESVIVLTKSEIDLGGFPFLARIAARSVFDERVSLYDAGLLRLKTIVEADVALLDSRVITPDSVADPD